MKLLRHLLPTILAATALASCAQPPAEPESRRLASDLRTLIGPASCTSDSQCRTVAVGSKACGGPGGYWAWSTEGTDAKRLAELAARQAEAEKRETLAAGLRSDCRVVTDPGAACVARRCELANSPGASAR